MKADAYGHGAVEVSRALVQEGVEGLAVAWTGEALELREAGLDGPIVVLFGAEKATVPLFFEHRLTPVLWDEETAQAFSAEAVRRGGRPVPVHVKVDTGMGRLGMSAEGAVERVCRIAALPGVVVEGLLSHFSDADLVEPAIADEQVRLFRRVREGAARQGVRPRYGHLANSAAVIRYPDAHFEMVRPGLMLYGYNPIPGYPGVDLRPVMSVETRVVAVKEVPKGTAVSYGRTWRAPRRSRIATIGIGYADGYSRLFSSGADVIVEGRRAPVVGRVCMDLTLIDVTELPEVRPGQRVTLLGGTGAAVVDADELAARAGTIPYEILTGIGRRVRRVYG